MKRRWQRVIALTAALVIVVPLALLAARWQWNRNEERQALNAQLEWALQQPVADLSAVELTDTHNEWRRVRTLPHWGSETRYWRLQSLDGAVGVTAVTTVATGSGPLPVLIGWAAEPNSVALPTAATTAYLVRMPDCPASDPGDLPAGQTNCPRTLARTADWMLQMVTAPDGWGTLPLPQEDAGPHLGYVGQWILIALTAVITYVSLMRRLDEGVTPEQ